MTTTQQAQIRATLRALLIAVSVAATILWLLLTVTTTILKGISDAAIALADSLQEVQPATGAKEPAMPNLLPPVDDSDSDFDIEVEAIPTEVLVAVLEDNGVPTTAKNGRRLSRPALVARVKKLQES